jgi:IclR family transcriptional regulator, acetate operon repressor
MGRMESSLLSREDESGTAIDKALDVLDAISAQPEGLSPATLGAQLAIPRTTLYRILGLLQDRKLVRRDPARKTYCLGARSFELARQAHQMPDLSAAANQELRLLRDLTGETTYLSTMDGREVLYLERFEGAHSQRSKSRLGERKPLHCTSQGKAMLAALDPQERDQLLRDIVLRSLTPNTITDRRRLSADLRVCALRGYAVDDEEIVLGIRCVGAAITDRTGKLRGAISVAGPAYRLDKARLEQLGPEVAEVARRIGAQLTPVTPLLSGDEVQVVAGDWAFDGGSICWHPEHACLYWADTLAPSIHSVPAPYFQDELIAQPLAPIGCLAVYEQSIVFTSDSKLWRLSADKAILPQATHLSEKEVQISALTSFSLDNNDQVQLWGCVHVPQGAASRCVVKPLTSTCSSTNTWNIDAPLSAMLWDPANQRLLALSESGTDLLFLTPGSNSVRRLASVPKSSGHLSGLALDGQGGIWSALNGGWGVIRFTSDGAVDRIVGLPIRMPGGLALVDKHLYVTSSRQALALEAISAAPLSGRLFRVLVN